MDSHDEEAPTATSMRIDEANDNDADDDNDDDKNTPPSLPNLPLELYPKIAACLDYVSDDLSNLCTSLEDRGPDTNGGGDGEIVDKILGGNEEYLRHIVASTTNTNFFTHVRGAQDDPSVAAKAKAKILQWMESNPSWRERCVPPTPAKPSPTSDPPSFCRFSIHHSDYDKLNLHEFQPGVVSFQGYVGTQFTGALPREGDMLYVVGGVRVSGWTLDRVNDTVSDVDVSVSPTWILEFIFVRDANFIFSNPPAAIEFGLEPVLRHMIDNEIVGVRDRYNQSELKTKNDGGVALLYHAVSCSPDISCFRYLMSLPDIHSLVWSPDGHSHLIHWCAFSSASFSLDALEMALQHPQIPGVNDDVDKVADTPLYLLCRRREMSIGMRLKKLEMLLAYGAADPPVGGKACLFDDLIGFLRRVCSEQEQNKPEFKQMVNLLQGAGTRTSLATSIL